MPKLSQRADQMPASPIRKLVPFAEQAKKRGVEIFHLNIGQPDIETPKEFFDAVRNISEPVLAYSHSAGNKSYRKKLAGYYQKNGIEVHSENIMVTTGGSEALLFGFMSCLNPGDEIIIPEPFYANYNGFSVSAGVKVVAVESNIRSGFALPPIASFEELIGPKTKAIMVCNPNNPTGYLYSKKELQELRSLVLKHDLFLFADEVYREFVYDGKEHYSVLELEGLEENAVVFDSISKRYSACGARIGAIVTRNQAILDSALKMGQARLSPPSLAQIGAEAALDVGSDYFDNVLQEYKSRRDLVVRRLNQMPDVFCPNPGGAFYCTVELPIDNSDRFCQWMLEEFDHQGQTVMMAPATGFYSRPGLGTREVRIAYVLEGHKLSTAMDVLEEGLKAYASKIKAERAEASTAYNS